MYQIWLDDTKYAVVDEVDYEWAKQWRWHPMANSTGLKFYATRMTRERYTRKNVRIWLHKEILKRMKKRRRSIQYSVGDHADGESLNCCRYNLSWATIKMNNCPVRKQRKMLEAKGYLIDAEGHLMDGCSA